MRVRELAIVCALLCGACKQIDVVAIRDAAQAPASKTDASVPNVDARVPDMHAPDAAAIDARQPDAPMPCAYDLQTAADAAAQVNAASARQLHYAICSCAGLSSSDALTTDAFDSTHGAYLTGESGGDVGVNDEMSAESLTKLGGRLVVAGSGGLHLGDHVNLDVGDDLRVAGPLEGALASARVAGSAQIAGRIDLAQLTVLGTLMQPAGSERSVSGTSEITTTAVGDVSVPAPCDCDDAALFDTSAFVAAQAPLAEPLPAEVNIAGGRCAAYRLPDAEATSVHVSVASPTALYATGDLHVTGDLILDVPTGAALDLFIAGNVRVDGRLVVGAKSDQGPVRIYVGGSGTVQLGSGGELHGVLYAPNAELVLSQALTVYGAVFVRRVAATAAVTLHYDRGLLRNAGD